jgi:hypothetical protein
VTTCALRKGSEDEDHWPRATCTAPSKRRATSATSSSVTCTTGSARAHSLGGAGSFKVSNDPQFEEKVVDVVGLYMNPPDKALVLCVDEESQIQALDRTQPGLPMKKGRAATMTHDYKRHGTTTVRGARREERSRYRRVPAKAPDKGVLGVPEERSTAPCRSTSVFT